MTIGIDLDGVLFDSESWYRSYAELYDIKLNREGSYNDKEMIVENKYNWTTQEFKQFIDECLPTITLDAPLKPYAKEVLKLLKARGHKLIIVSARGDLSDWEVGATYERLKKEGLAFDKIYSNQTNKAITCKEEGVDVMIEDSINNVNLLAQNEIRCLYFRELPSPSSNNSYITEIYSWGEAYRKILEMEEAEKKN